MFLKGLYKMKKMICGMVIALASISTFATTSNIDPQFAHVQKLLQAKDFTNAYKELEKLSKTGNSQATYNLGYLTQKGQGTKADNKKAVELYEQAAKSGYSIANYVLAQNYATGGLGLKKSHETALQYLEKASEQGFDDATVELAIFEFAKGTDASNKLALAKLEPLIKKGHYAAIHAKALYDLSQGIQNKNVATTQQGLKGIQDLADKGYIPALIAVANMFVNGNIVNQNLVEARKIFEELDKQNIPEAKEGLATVNALIQQNIKNAGKVSKPAQKP